MLMNGITGLRLQNEQKRQANIRRIASELSRKRLVTMMQYLATQSLRIDAQMGTSQDLPPMDWQRHDPAEKAFYNGIVTQMDRFKKTVDLYICRFVNRNGTVTMTLASDSMWGGPNLSIPLRDWPLDPLF